jgi:hypothetical protein
MKKTFKVLCIIFLITSTVTILAWCIAFYVHQFLHIEPLFWQIPIAGNILQIIELILIRVIDRKINRRIGNNV